MNLWARFLFLSALSIANANRAAELSGSRGSDISDLKKKLGGEVCGAVDESYHTIRARLALEKLEALAAFKDVSFIAPAAQAMLNRARQN